MTPDRSIILVQIVSLLLGLAAIGVSLVNSTILGTVATFFVPVFFLLSFGGVLVESRMSHS